MSSQKTNSPLKTDSLTLLFMLAARPDVELKRDAARKSLGSDQQSAADAAAPLLERGWIERHIQRPDLANTRGYTVTAAGQTAALQITQITNQSF